MSDMGKRALQSYERSEFLTIMKKHNTRVFSTMEGRKGKK
jgi:hypothetical protein